MRFQAKLIILVATASTVAVCAPALAAGEKLAVLGDGERREATSERAMSGPFHPVVGKLDYGTAENAFGAARSGHVHTGHDIFSSQGTPLVAPADGVVVETGADAGRGNYLSIHDPKRDLTYSYFHMVDTAVVEAKDKLEAGERVGSMGCTGSCSGVHLHFEVRKGTDAYGEAIDPVSFLEEWRPLDQPR